MAERTREAVLREILYHREILSGLESLAGEALDRGRYDAAAAYAQVAADYAWHNHPGVFASPRLEGILREIGHRVLPAADGPGRVRTAAGRPATVLHVLTEAGAIGGHTRFAWRWIRQDRGPSHSVVLTAPLPGSPPRALEESVALGGGEVHVLGGTSLVGRARTLREVAASFDLVALYVHPFDVVPAIGFSGPTHPPVVLVNHADHVFWVGAAVADVVASIRRSGLLLAQRRRGIASARCALLPVPVDVAARTRTRTEAKAALGYPEAAVLLLTVGQAYKYRPLRGVSFLDTAGPVVEDNPEALLVAVGPSEDDAWRAARERTGGRIRALGPRHDVAAFYQAADVYLDPWPLGSLTSLVEAASFGVPGVSLRLGGRDAEILCSDPPGLSEHLVRASTVPEYRAALSRLVEDPRHRRRAGEGARVGVLRTHTGRGWRRHLDDVYARAGAGPPASAFPASGDSGRPDRLDELVYEVQSYPGWSARLHEVIRAHAPLFPTGVGTWTRTLLNRAVARVPGVPDRHLHRLERSLFLRRAERVVQRKGSATGHGWPVPAPGAPTGRAGLTERSRRRSA
jgi:glycosyltransferase involved in cell wall biosynthesis